MLHKFNSLLISFQEFIVYIIRCLNVVCSVIQSQMLMALFQSFQKICHMCDFIPREKLLRKLKVFIFKICLLLCQNIGTHREDIWCISIDCAHPWPVRLWSCSSKLTITYEPWNWNTSFSKHRNLLLFRFPAYFSTTFPKCLPSEIYFAKPPDDYQYTYQKEKTTTFANLPLSFFVPSLSSNPKKVMRMGWQISYSMFFVVGY